jgi:hypothetical protein
MGVIPYLIVLARGYALQRTAAMREKAQLIKDENLRNEVVHALDRLDKTAETVAADLEQTLKKMSEQGKVVNPDQLKSASLVYTKARLPPASFATLQKTYGGNLDPVISSKIEQKALMLKLKKREVCK